MYILEVTELVLETIKVIPDRLSIDEIRVLPNEVDVIHVQTPAFFDPTPGRDALPEISGIDRRRLMLGLNTMKPIVLDDPETVIEQSANQPELGCLRGTQAMLSNEMLSMSQKGGHLRIDASALLAKHFSKLQRAFFRDHDWDGVRLISVPELRDEEVM